MSLEAFPEVSYILSIIRSKDNIKLGRSITKGSIPVYVTYLSYSNKVGNTNNHIEDDLRLCKLRMILRAA